MAALEIYRGHLALEGGVLPDEQGRGRFHELRLARMRLGGGATLRCGEAEMLCRAGTAPWNVTLDLRGAGKCRGVGTNIEAKAGIGMPSRWTRKSGSASNEPETLQYVSSASGGNHSAAAGQSSDNTLSIRSYHSCPKTAHTHDADVDFSLPSQTLSNNADIPEYRIERTTREIEGPYIGNGCQEHYRLIVFTPNNPGNSKNWSTACKWCCTNIVTIACFVITLASSNILADFSRG